MTETKTHRMLSPPPLMLRSHHHNEADDEEWSWNGNSLSRSLMDSYVLAEAEMLGRSPKGQLDGTETQKRSEIERREEDEFARIMLKLARYLAKSKLTGSTSQTLSTEGSGVYTSPMDSMGSTGM